MFEMAVWWENTEMIEPPSVFHCRPEGVPVAYVWKLSNCLLPIPQCHVCFLDSLCLVSQSFLNFAVWFIHQTLNQTWSIPKQVFWLWGLCPQRNCISCFSNCSENITYKMRNTCLQNLCKVEDEYFLSFHDSLWGSSSSSSEITFCAHLTLILYS